MFGGSSYGTKSYATTSSQSGLVSLLRFASRFIVYITFKKGFQWKLPAIPFISFITFRKRFPWRNT